MSSPDLEQRSHTLRLDLKAWEKTFAATNHGRKAGRVDIKADAVISQKYKEYNKLRDVLSGRTAPQTPSKRVQRHESPDDLDPTSQVPQALATTPLKRKREDSVNVPEVPASPNQFMSPQGRLFIGPTPQRDGRVLGLFDLLPVGTPSKSRIILTEVAPNLLRTPSKSAGKAESEASLESRVRGDRTPLSVGKRFMLDQFITPKKRKLDEEGTPTSALKGFSTPAFLRRDNFLVVIDETQEPTPRPAPWKRRGLGRSLSSMIQSMKKQEEDRLDEEADIMREFEMEDEGMPAPRNQRLPDVLVENSQQVDMPLGPDRGSESDGSEGKGEEQLGADVKPRKVWKKKGLKRQTRRVIMRPNFTKPKPPPTQEQFVDSDEEESNVTETQVLPADAASVHDLSSDDASDYASDDSHAARKRKTQKKKTADVSTVSSKAGEEGEEGPVKSAARKIKASAHANYRRLKIKSKGGNGGKGRFGRRR